MENLFSFSRKNNKDREREKRMVPEEKAVQLFNREREKGFWIRNLVSTIRRPWLKLTYLILFITLYTYTTQITDDQKI